MTSTIDDRGGVGTLTRRTSPPTRRSAGARAAATTRSSRRSRGSCRSSASSRTRRCSSPASAAPAGSSTTWTRTACTASTAARLRSPPASPRRAPTCRVWIVTGDGDALSIGGNHLIHALRRNVNLKILLFNNQIYGLTKGQYSPTSARRARSRSPRRSARWTTRSTRSPLALGAEATFVARTIDNDRQHLTEVLRQAAGAPRARRSSRSIRTATCSTTARSTCCARRRAAPTTRSGSATASRSSSTRATTCVVVGDNGRLAIAATAETTPEQIVVHDAHGRPVAGVRAGAPVARAPASPRASACSGTSNARSTATRCTRRSNSATERLGSGRPGDAAARRRHLDGGSPWPAGAGSAPRRGRRNRARASVGRRSTSRSSRRARAAPRGSRRCPPRSCCAAERRRGTRAFRAPICSRTGDGSPGGPEQSEPAPSRNPRSSSAIISVGGSSPSTEKQTRCGARWVACP